ncbi:MAG: hypothetical protein O8C67_10725 [Candidatus Methanoperedens sp.]|nr:hypothetical protein [Candidatus Methanoperedens sp.]
MERKKDFYVIFYEGPIGEKMLKFITRETAEEQARELAKQYPDVNIFLLEPTLKFRNNPRIDKEFIY